MNQLPIDFLLSTKGCVDGREETIAEELIAGFTELAGVLESGGDIDKRFNCHQRQLDLRPETPTRLRSRIRGSDWTPVRRHLPGSSG